MNWRDEKRTRRHEFVTRRDEHFVQDLTAYLRPGLVAKRSLRSVTVIRVLFCALLRSSPSYMYDNEERIQILAVVYEGIRSRDI